MSRRVVVTGIGAITPIGIGKKAFFEGMRAGKIGVDKVTGFDASGLTCQVAGEVKDFNPEDYINKKDVKRMDRFTHFAVAAGREALEDSGIKIDEVDATRLGVCLGSGIGGLGTLEDQHTKMLEKGPSRVSPFLIPMMIVNIAAGNMAIEFGAKGPNTTVVTACASGTNAIGDAYHMIKRGAADMMFTGGAEASITPLGMAGFCSLKAMSTRNDDPKSASRPFDKDRDGFVMGEGAGILVIEELEHALKRGAKIYGEIAGYGMSCDAYHITSPTPGGEGAARSMKLALEDAGIKPEAVDYINAHGTSTPYNDKFETEAIKSVFGQHAYNLHVTSTKSMTGHTLGAAGGLEAIACLMSVSEDYIHGTMGVQEIDPELDLNYLPNKGIEKTVNYALSNSLGFGGHNATVIIKKYAK